MSWSLKQVKSGRLALFVAAFTALLAGGCLMTYDPDSVELAVVGPGYVCSSGERSLNVLSPTANQQITGNEMVVQIVVCGLTLVEKWGQENVTGEGHLVISVDDRFAHPPDEGLVTTHFRLPLVVFEPGQHLFRAQVRNNDLTSINDISPVEITFTLVASEQ